MTAPRWLRAIAVVFVLFVVVVSVVVPAVRRSILRSAGWALVVNERIASADVIVISGEGDGPGVLEAADLVHSGVATKVAVFAYAPDAVEREFNRRGVPYENRTDHWIRELKMLGVNAEPIPTYVNGTENEGPVLARWCHEQGFHSVIVVGRPDHSRRLRRVLYRSMKGYDTRLTVCSSPYSDFDPDQWWNSRGGIRAEIVESQKLMLDILRHPTL